MKSAAIDQDEWLKELRKCEAERVPQIPNGWLTISALSEKMKLGLTHTRLAAEKLVRSGKAEKKSFRVMQANGPHPATHYKRKV